MTNALRTARLQLGVCYYPEHWPEDLWADDYRRMVEFGFTVVRVGEFAWSIFEPEEGRFDFSLFDRALDRAHEHGLEVILGTPTATPPAWLTYRYPEVLNARPDGVRYSHGMRRHYNYNAPIYRELSARIVRELAEHYADHPAVVGWQIDNELNCEVDSFYSEADHDAFRHWTKEQYGTLENLNQAWGAVFWNQTYTAWEQIRLPGPTPSSSPNPHQALDEKRFFSESAISFAKLQADILREIAPDHWITTNGMFGHLDNHRLTEETLDFYSFDSYPNFGTIFPEESTGALQDRAWGWFLAKVRDVSPNFCVMEQQSGPGGWTNRIAQPSPKPGQMRLWTYQSIAHGADMVLFFRWRTATVGSEIYWHGINDYHNQPNRRIEEVARIGKEIERIGERIAGTRVRARVAILSDYNNEWDGELDLWHGPYTHRSVWAWFAALQRRHIPVDSVHLGSSSTDLEAYDALVYPHPAIMTEATAAHLEAYAKQGGTIIFGCRTGYKDEHGHCYMRPLPGVASELSGVTVDEFTRVEPGSGEPMIRWCGTGKMTTAFGFNDVLKVSSSDVQVLARYAGAAYEGAPALVRNPVGNGHVYYFGAVFDENAVTEMIGHLGLESPCHEWLEVPAEVEVAIREDATSGEQIAFLLNYSGEPQRVVIKGSASDLLGNETVSEALDLEPYGVAVLSPSK